MERNDLIKGLQDKIKAANSLKREFPNSDILKVYIKDIKNIVKVLNSGGNVLDIQNVCRWNYSGYFKVNVPFGVSLKEYREKHDNKVDIFVGLIPVSFQLSNDGINYISKTI